MSIISDALRKASDKGGDRIILRDRVGHETLSPEIRRIAARKTRWNISSSLGTLIIVGFVVFLFLYNAERLFPPQARPSAGSYEYVKPEIKPEDVKTRREEPLPKEAVLKRESARDAQLFILDGIMEGSGEPLAIINDRILREGDYVSGARIMKINQDAVILERGNKEIRLKLE